MHNLIPLTHRTHLFVAYLIMPPLAQAAGTSGELRGFLNACKTAVVTIKSGT